MAGYKFGFDFLLDISNEKWRAYSNNEAGKANKMGVYTVARYFYVETQDKLKKVFPDNPNFTSLENFANACLKLSEDNIKDWKLLYNNDLLQHGESCLIGIPGYYYPHDVKRESAYSIVNRNFKANVNQIGGIEILEYADLVEKIFVLRFGAKPQDYIADKPADYLLPSPLFGRSDHAGSGNSSGTEAANVIQTEIEIQKTKKGVIILFRGHSRTNAARIGIEVLTRNGIDN